MGAVANIFKNRRGPEPLPVGGLKANIGHSEAVSENRPHGCFVN